MSQKLINLNLWEFLHKVGMSFYAKTSKNCLLYIYRARASLKNVLNENFCLFQTLR